MKTLVVYYSRTGTTKKIGNMLADKLGADREEIRDTVDRSGPMGYIISGRDAMKRKLTKLAPLKFDPSGYDLVVIGTPVWGWNMSAPVRTYISENKDKFKNVAFFCTMGGSGDVRVFSEARHVIGKEPKAALALRTAEVTRGNISGKLEDFIKKLA